MNVATAKDIARSWTASNGQTREAARVLLVELERVERRNTAWDDALGAVVPELEREMAPERPRLVGP